MSDHKHIWEMCVCGAFREGRAVQDDGLDVERLGQALDRAMGTQASGVAPSEYRHLIAAYYADRAAPPLHDPQEPER